MSTAFSASIGTDTDTDRMELKRRIIGGLVNSISRFIHLVACQTTKSTPVLKELRSLVGMLKLMKSVLDEVLESQIPLNEQLKAFEELDVLVNEARELLEKQPQRASTICNILRCGPLVMKVQRSSMEICCYLKNLLDFSSLPSLSTCVQHCIQELQCADQDVISELIEKVLRDQRENIVVDQGHMMKIVESLGLTSNREILMEHIALEKEIAKIELKQKKEDTDIMYQIIEVVKQIKGCMAELEQFGLINGLPIPSYFRCPLSLELMLDPVILASGVTYERYFIQKWLDHGLRLCPETRQNLSHTNLVPNHTVKTLIANWCEENGIRLAQSVGSKDASFPKSSPKVSKDVSHGNGFPGSLNRNSTARLSHEVGNELEQQRAGISPENDEVKDPHDSQSISQVVFNYNRCLDQQSYSHCRNYSVSSVNSTTELLSKSENKMISSDCLASLSKKDHIFSPWLSSSQVDCAKVGDHNGHGKFSSSTGSGCDVLATTFHIQKLIEDLKGQSCEGQTAAALELRLLAKHNSENRVLIAKCGAIASLISLLYSKVKVTQENAVTALLNLSIDDNNKTAIAEAGAMEPLIHVLKCGNTQAKENSAASLFSLSVMEEYKIKIGCSGAVKPLVDLLGYGTLRGKKDASAALFNLSIFHENKARIVQAGAVKYLVELLDPETGMVDKAVALLANLSTIPEGRLAISQEGGIPLLVEVVETGSQRGKENAASTLLQLCINSPKFCSLVLQEGAVPPLIALTQRGTPRAKEKAQQILGHFRSLREGALGKGRS